MFLSKDHFLKLKIVFVFFIACLDGDFDIDTHLICVLLPAPNYRCANITWINWVKYALIDRIMMMPLFKRIGNQRNVVLIAFNSKSQWNCHNLSD